MVKLKLFGNQSSFHGERECMYHVIRLLEDWRSTLFFTHTHTQSFFYSITLLTSIFDNKCEQLYQFLGSLSQDNTEFGTGNTLRCIGKISYSSTFLPVDGVVGESDEGGRRHY